MQTRKKSLLTFLIILAATAATFAQVSISGNALTYRNQTIVFYRYADLITNTEEELAKCDVDSSGNFNCNLKINETSFIYSNTGIYKLYLFVEPGKSYRIVLPEYEPKSEGQRLNPFFRETDVHVGIEQMDPNDLNYLISSFDLAFNENFDQIVRDAYAGIESISVDSRACFPLHRSLP